MCLSAGTSAAGPAKGARSTPPSPPASNPLAPPQPLGQGYQQYRLQQGRDDVPGLPGYQKQGLSEGITLRVKGRRRGRGVTGEPRGSPEGSSATWKTKRGQRCPHTRPLLSSRETPYQPPHLLLHLTPAPPSLRPGPASPRPGLRRPGPLHTTLGPSRQPSRPSSISTRPGLLSARASSHPGLEEKGLLVTRSRSALPAFLPSSALRAPTPQPPGLQRGGETPSPPAHPLPPSSQALRLSPRGLSLLEAGPLARRQRRGLASPVAAAPVNEAFPRSTLPLGLPPPGTPRAPASSNSAIALLCSLRLP